MSMPRCDSSERIWMACVRARSKTDWLPAMRRADEARSS